MTKKDFEIISDILRTNKPKGDEDSVVFRYWLSLVEEFTDDLEAHNPRFDKERLLKACGYGN